MDDPFTWAVVAFVVAQCLVMFVLVVRSTLIRRAERRSKKRAPLGKDRGSRTTGSIAAEPQST